MLALKNISFSYTENTPVINSISLNLQQGQHIALLGESGCGKSTLLKLIYGLYDLNEGEIFWKDQQVLGPAYHLVPGMEYMKYLAQDFDLMPHISVAENIGKYLSNFNLDKKKARIAELLELIEMTEFADTYVKFLSGGQQQRVALAKVLAAEPEILLLDEPFSHIDYSRRSVLRRKVFNYLKQNNITCIVATHDSMDVLSFADETVVLKNGEIIDYGETKELYEFPNDKYVATLFGEVNELYISDFNPTTEEDEILLVYPHQLMISKTKGILEVEVQHAYFNGDGYLVYAKFLNNREIYFNHPIDVEKGSFVKLALKKHQ